MGFLDNFKRNKREYEDDAMWDDGVDEENDNGWGDEENFETMDGPVAPSEPITPAPATPAVALKIVTPKSYDDAREITDFLMNGNTILINMDGIDRDLARRVIDYLRGAVQVVDGVITKASKTTLVVAPKTVDISSIEEMVGSAE